MSARHGLAVALLVALACGGCVRSVSARAENWWSIRTAHVHLESDTGRDRTLELAADLEELHGAMSAAFYHCNPPDDVLEVAVLSNEREFEELAGDDVGGRFLPARTGLYPVAPRVIVDDRHLRDFDGRQVLAHEVAHRFVDACFPAAPPWLHEGLASVFETIYVEDRSVVAGFPRYRIQGSWGLESHLERGFFVQSVERALVPSASELLSLPTAAFYESDAPITQHVWHLGRTAHYAAAWALVHMLALGPDPHLRSAFRAYLEALTNATADPADAFRIAFDGIPLDRYLDAYLAANHFDIIERTDRSDPSALAARGLVPTEGHALRAELAYQTSHRETALAHLALAGSDPRLHARALLLRAELGPVRLQETRVTEALRNAPDELDVLRAAAMLAARVGNFEVAGRIVGRLAERSDLRVIDLVVMADVERQLGNLVLARADARRALTMDRRSALAWHVLACVAADTGDVAARERAQSAVAHLTHRTSQASLAALEWIRSPTAQDP